jgi:oligopeptidase B
MADTDSPELLAYLEQENAHCQEQSAGDADLREAVYLDIAARTKQTDSSVPAFARHGQRAYWYYTRTSEGLDYPVYLRCPATGRADYPGPHPAGEEVLLDCNAVARGSAYFDLGTFDVSPDGRILAYCLDCGGDERYELRFLDIETGQAVGGPIGDVAADGAWRGSRYCYLRVDEAWRPFQVWSHDLTGGEPDQLLLQEDDERFWLGLDESRDNRWTLVLAASKTTSQTWLLDAADTDRPPQPFLPRREGVEYYLELTPRHAYVTHNMGAPDFMVSRTGFEADQDPSAWTTVVEHVPGRRLLGFEAYQRALVLSYQTEGLPKVALADPAGPWNFRELPCPTGLGCVQADAAEEYDTDRVRLAACSFANPPRVYDHVFADGSETELRRLPVLDHPRFGPYSPDDYVERRLWAEAADGARVPVSLIHRRDWSPGGPCLLTGYGAYEHSLTPAFSIPRLSLLDRGFSYAVAHVRGGGELGRAWYEQGRLAAKGNTFADFIACARLLLEAGVTRADRLAIHGGSAGGLLIGAVLNQAPELFACAQADVPFVDPLNALADPDLPLTVTEWEEWGDPLRDRAAYELIKSYSPYENVARRDYPPLLVTASLNDTRVEITEPAKWVARLRHCQPSAEIAFKTELSAGHAGVSGRYAAWREEAFEQAWLMRHCGYTGL